MRAASRGGGCYDRGLMKGTVMLSHGLESGPNATKVSALARVADVLGWQSVRPDFLDIDARKDPRAIDARIARLLASTPAQGRIVFGGSSMGAFVSGFASLERRAAGLFLLTGATGAGKSSVLDAVCFALYGEVPGDRHDAKHLRSDHAPAEAVPEVRLEFSVGERRFLFTRSPAWERPKRRGTGTTRQQARVVIEESRAGQWLTLTTRLDDAGLLVTDLLGPGHLPQTRMTRSEAATIQPTRGATGTGDGGSRDG